MKPKPNYWTLKVVYKSQDEASQALSVLEMAATLCRLPIFEWLIERGRGIRVTKKK